MSSCVSTVVSGCPPLPLSWSLKIGPSIIQRVYFNWGEFPKDSNQVSKRERGWCVCRVFRDDCTNGASYGWSEFSHFKNMFGLVWKVVFLVIILPNWTRPPNKENFAVCLFQVRCLLLRHSLSIGKKINRRTRKYLYTLTWFGYNLHVVFFLFCFDLLCFPLKDSFMDSFLYSPSQDIKDLNLESPHLMGL